MSATEVAADLRAVAALVKSLVGPSTSRYVEVADRLETLADSFDRPPWEEAELAARVAVDEEDAVDALMAIKDAGFVVLRPAAVSAQEGP